MVYCIVAVAALLAGSMQTMTGFGSAICMMLFLPNIFSLIDSSSISTTISLFLTLFLFLKYRKYVKLSICGIPIFIYCIGNFIATKYLTQINSNSLYVAFGFFLIALSVYLLFFSEKLRVKRNLPTAVVCSVISCLTASLFSIGGPIMAVYFMSATDNNEDYLGNLQSLFLLSNLLTVVNRAVNGIYSVRIIPYAVTGMAAVFLGCVLGERLKKK